MLKRTILLMLILSLMIVFSACSSQPKQANVAELLSLGGQYLTELDYEQALVQFLKVIEIEPRNVRAYLGAAEAYVGSGQVEDAIAILERGRDEVGNDPDLLSRLEELLMMPHHVRWSNADGENGVFFGQRDLQGRWQGLRVQNIFGADGALRYVEEGEYLDDELVGIRKNWWFPDENVNQQYGVTDGCGRGAGEYRDGERNGYNEQECYIGYTINAREGEMVRWDDCVGHTMIWAYRGIRVNGEQNDDTGTAYVMYTSRNPEHPGQIVEYIGQIKDGERHGYGQLWQDGVMSYDGQWVDGNPVQ